MQFARYVAFVRRWWWLMALCAVVAAGVTYAFRQQQPIEYTAQTSVIVGRFFNNPNPNTADIRVGIELSETYAQLAEARTVLQAAIDSLGVEMSPSHLRGITRVSIIKGTSLLRIAVTYGDPVLAADLANALAEQLIAQSPSLTDEELLQIDNANAQIDALNAQLETARAELDTLNAQIDATDDPDERLVLLDQREVLLNQIYQASSTIAQFTSTIVSVQERANSVSVLDPATIPPAPNARPLLSFVLMGAVFGAVVAAGIGLVVESLDDTIKSTEQVMQLLDLPILGEIPRFGRRTGDYASRLIGPDNVLLPFVDTYQMLRTNLQFDAPGGEKPLYFLTSALKGEGKTLTAVNLSIITALHDANVLLIDGDLRQPSLQDVFRVENQDGFSTLLAMRPEPGQGERGRRFEQQVRDALPGLLKPTHVQNLKLLTSGTQATNPTQLVDSAHLTRVIRAILQQPDIDVVVIDGPPSLITADAGIIARRTGACVLLVIAAGHTRATAATKAAAKLAQLGIRVKGVVMNRIEHTAKQYGYGYGYSGMAAFLPSSGTHDAESADAPYTESDGEAYIERPPRRAAPPAANTDYEDALFEEVTYYPDIPDGISDTRDHNGYIAYNGNATSNGSGPPLDLNRATRHDLMMLPYVGPRLADEILRYRITHNGFRSLAELKQIPGVGLKTLQIWNGLIAIDPVEEDDEDHNP